MEDWFLNVTVPPSGIVTGELPQVVVAGLKVALSRISSPAMFTAPTQYQLFDIVTVVRGAPVQVPVTPEGTRVPEPGV
jgi:hypothetical protein